MESNSTNSNSTETNTTTNYIELAEDSYVIWITALVIIILVVVCVISICVRASKKAKKILKKQKKALLKMDHVSLALLGNQNPYNSSNSVVSVGYIDPNAYPYIPPNFAYPSAYPQLNR